MPDSIKRPDYATHIEGKALSEEKMRGNTQIRVNDDDDIEAMRVVGKLARGKNKI